MLRSRGELRIDLSASKLRKPYYTTLDEISGRVIFAPQSLVLVKDVIIDFLGFAKTWVDPAMPGTPRKKAIAPFLKMNDDKEIREPTQASKTNPLELPFTFVVPRELLPTICRCPTDAQHPQHLHLPPSMGTWPNCDDMSADMSKIEYQIYVKVLAISGNRTSVAAEASEPIQVLPVYSWWHRRQSEMPLQASPIYERVPSLLQVEPPASKTIGAEKVIKKGLFGKKKGKVSMSVEVPDSYFINVGQGGMVTPNSLTMPVKLRYTPISADLPPNVSSLGARLQAHTSYNVDGRGNPGNSGVYNTSVVILKTSTPSTPTPLWLEDPSNGELTFISNLLIPTTLPPAAGSNVEKGAKVLLPSFESCLISRNYDIELRIGFEAGNDISLCIPITILAKPATSEAESAMETAIREANEWVPPDQAVAMEVEPELLRPTLENLRSSSQQLVSVASTESEETEESEEIEEIQEVNGVEVSEEVEPIPLDDPPQYETVVTPMDKDLGVIVQVTALAA